LVMRNSLLIHLPLQWLFTFSMICISQSTVWSDDSSGSIFHYARPSTTRSVSSPRLGQPQRAIDQTATPIQGLTDSPAYHEENIFGFPIHQDPLFDDEPRPSWAPPIENKSLYDRPTYDRPDYDAPIIREDPIHKPVYEKPMYELPIDDKPKYNIQYDQAPAYFKPSVVEPVYLAPNYVIKPYVAPAYDHQPAFDQSGIECDRPEYLAPVYNPQEYRTPRYVPPPYIAPPE